MSRYYQLSSDLFFSFSNVVTHLTVKKKLIYRLRSHSKFETINYKMLNHQTYFGFLVFFSFLLLRHVSYSNEILFRHIFHWSDDKIRKLMSQYKIRLIRCSIREGRWLKNFYIFIKHLKRYAALVYRIYIVELAIIPIHVFVCQQQRKRKRQQFNTKNSIIELIGTDSANLFCWLIYIYLAPPYG